MSKRIALFLFSAILMPPALPAQVWHFPGEAMDDLTRLTREALFEKWNPMQLYGTSPEAPGEYVQYQHETLTYYFGPFFDAGSTERAQAKLLDIQQQLLERDPRFATSRVSLHRSGPVSSQAQQSPAETPEKLPAEIPEQTTPEGLTEDDMPHVGNDGNPIAFWISSVLVLIGAGLILNVRRPSHGRQ